MARDDAPQGLMPSILDRLIDPESAGTAWRRGYGVEQMIDAVLRDVDDLLNTHLSREGVPAEYVELHRSIFVYGVPELVSLNAVTPQERLEIGRKLEEVISTFEPRLKYVRASVLPATNAHDRNVRFRVEARLALDPAPPVAFDTVLELTTGQCSIRPSEG